MAELHVHTFLQENGDTLHSVQSNNRTQFQRSVNSMLCRGHVMAEWPKEEKKGLYTVSFWSLGKSCSSQVSPRLHAEVVKALNLPSTRVEAMTDSVHSSYAHIRS